MTTLNLGAPPAGANDKATLNWIVRSIKAIEQHLKASDVSLTTDAFQLTDRDALVPLRTLDETAASTSDVRQFLATLIYDLNRRGSKGI